MYWFFRETWSKGRSIRNQIKNKKAIDISKNNAKDGGCSGFDPPPARRSYNMLCHERHRRGTWVELSLAPDRMNFHCWASISSAERGSADQSERLNPLPFLYGWKLPCQCNQPQKNTTNKAPFLLGAPPYHSKFVGREGTLSLRTILFAYRPEWISRSTLYSIEISLMQKRRERTERGCAKWELAMHVGNFYPSMWDQPNGRRRGGLPRKMIEIGIITFFPLVL